MKKSITVLSLGVLVLAMCLVVGCGQGSDTSADADSEATTEAHDCAGDCGMKEVPVEQLTEVDGKFFCGGCVDKAKEGDHSGHGHG